MRIPDSQANYDFYYDSYHIFYPCPSLPSISGE